MLTLAGGTPSLRCCVNGPPLFDPGWIFHVSLRLSSFCPVFIPTQNFKLPQGVHLAIIMSQLPARKEVLSKGSRALCLRGCVRRSRPRTASW